MALYILHSSICVGDLCSREFLMFKCFDRLIRLHSSSSVDRFLKLFRIMSLIKFSIKLFSSLFLL